MGTPGMAGAQHGKTGTQRGRGVSPAQPCPISCPVSAFCHPAGDRSPAVPAAGSILLLPALEAFLRPGHLGQLAPAPAGVVQELAEPGHHLLAQRADGQAPVPHPVPWGCGGDGTSAGDKVTVPVPHWAPSGAAGWWPSAATLARGWRAPAPAHWCCVTSRPHPGVCRIRPPAKNAPRFPL